MATSVSSIVGYWRTDYQITIPQASKTAFYSEIFLALYLLEDLLYDGLGIFHSFIMV